jgi:hypothetical protein
MEYLTLAVASSLNTTGDELSAAIRRAVNKTVAFVSALPEPQRANFALYGHVTLPPASAILIDLIGTRPCSARNQGIPR